MMENTFYLEPCPVCRRKPKVKIETFPTGSYVTVSCRSFWGKTHLTVSRGRCLEHRAVEDAVIAWNCEAKHNIADPCTMGNYHFMLKDEGKDMEVL